MLTDRRVVGIEKLRWTNTWRLFSYLHFINARRISNVHCFPRPWYIQTIFL